METIKTIFQKIYEIKNSHFSELAPKSKVSPGLTFGILRYMPSKKGHDFWDTRYKVNLQMNVQFYAEIKFTICAKRGGMMTKCSISVCDDSAFPIIACRRFT